LSAIKESFCSVARFEFTCTQPLTSRTTRPAPISIACFPVSRRRIAPARARDKRRRASRFEGLSSIRVRSGLTTRSPRSSSMSVRAASSSHGAPSSTHPAFRRPRPRSILEPGASGWRAAAMRRNAAARSDMWRSLNPRAIARRSRTGGIVPSAADRIWQIWTRSFEIGSGDLYSENSFQRSADAIGLKTTQSTRRSTARAAGPSMSFRASCRRPAFHSWTQEVGVLLGQGAGSRRLVPGHQARRRALGIPGEQLALREVQELGRLREAHHAAGDRGRGGDAHLAQRPAESIGRLEQARAVVELRRVAREIALRDARIDHVQHRVVAEEERGSESLGLVLQARVLEKERVDRHRRAPHGVAARGGPRETRLRLADHRVLGRPRQRTRREPEVHRVAVEQAVQDLDPVRARDLGHAHGIDARVRIADPRRARAIAPQIGVFRRVGEEVDQSFLDPQGGLEASPTDQGQNAVPAARQALEKIREPDAANITLKGHCGVVELSARQGGRVEVSLL
jgi:hypothetical protein